MSNALLLLVIASSLAVLVADFIPDLGIVTSITLNSLAALSGIAINVATNSLPEGSPLSKLSKVFAKDFLRRWWAYFILPAVMILLIIARALPAIVAQGQNPDNLEQSIDFRTYIIDNSGSMGCINEGEVQENGYCKEVSGIKYPVDIAKEWIEKEIWNPNFKLERVSIIEVGGNTSNEGHCNIRTLVDVGLKSKEELTFGLNSIRANASGATNLGGAIYKATSDILDAQELSSINFPSREIIFITDLGDNCSQNGMSLNQIIPQLERRGYELENIKNLLTHTTVLKIGPKSERRREAFNPRYHFFRHLAVISLLPGSDAIAASSEVNKLLQLGINVLEIENYESFSSLPKKNKFRENLIYFIVPCTTFLITNILALFRETIIHAEYPHRQRTHISVDWSRWRANLWNQMFYNQRMPAPIGSSATFSFVVYTNRQIDSINVESENPEMEQFVRNRIANLRNTRALAFPKSTRRQKIQYRSQVLISKVGRRADPRNFPDQENYDI